MSETPLISVCIPTFNRPKQFERLLRSILKQEHSELLEIVVRDDSSNNKTLKIFEKYVSSSGIKTQYFKGEKIGLDAANVFLVEKASGKFIWWLSDDDELRSGAISKVFFMFSSNPELKYIWVDFQIGNSNQSAVGGPTRRFKSKNDVLDILGTNIGLVSTHIFCRKNALTAVRLAKQHSKGFGFAGLIFIFQVLQCSGAFFLLTGPILRCHPTSREEFQEKCRKDSDFGNVAFNAYGRSFPDALDLFRGHFSKQAIRSSKKQNFEALWRGLLVDWIYGMRSPIGFRLEILYRNWSFPSCWYACFLFLLPKNVVSLMYKLYKVFRPKSFGQREVI